MSKLSTTESKINGDHEVLIDISAIVTNPQWFYRSNLQDIDCLAESMAGPNGQLQAIIVDSQMNLVFGARRIAAAQSLGWTQIRARVIDLSDPLAAIQDENGCRVDFLPSEKVALAALIESHERAKAAERMKAGACANFSQGQDERGRSKDRVAAAVGWSRPTLVKAQEVIQWALHNPTIKQIASEMDETGNVSDAHRQLTESQWYFRRNLNYHAIVEFEQAELSEDFPHIFQGPQTWILSVSFEVEQNGNAYFHTEFLELDESNAINDRTPHHTVSIRARAGWAINRVLRRHFPESVLSRIQWNTNNEDWKADYVHCFMCGGNGKGDYGKNPDAKCDYCDGNGTVSKELSERNAK